MNKKILVFTITALSLILLTTPLIGTVAARRSRCCDWEDFTVNLVTTLDPAAMKVEDKGYKIVLSWPETMTDYSIMVGDKVYTLNNDFIYKGFAQFTAWKPTGENHPVLGFPIGEYMEFEVWYMYDFSAVFGGIDGKLKMHAISKITDAADFGVGGNMEIKSVWGTGDLRNVKIRATNGGPEGPSHVGKVCGWPDIQFFKMVISGAGDAETGYQWVCPPAPAEAEVVHVRNREWVIGDVLTLTVGADTYTMGGSPVDLSYYGIMDTDVMINNVDGNTTYVRVDEKYSIFYNGEKIGSIKLFVRSVLSPTEQGGTVWGYGTGIFRDIRIKGIDQVTYIPDPFFLELARVGEIRNWPGLPT